MPQIRASLSMPSSTQSQFISTLLHVYIISTNVDLLSVHRSLLYRSVVLSVVLGPAVSMLAGNLLEMQILGLHPNLQN